MKCEHLGIDIQDDMGRHEVGFVENTVKTPVGGNNEGCLFEARFHINKVLLLTSILYQRKITIFFVHILYYYQKRLSFDILGPWKFPRINA